MKPEYSPQRYYFLPFYFFTFLLFYYFCRNHVKEMEIRYIEKRFTTPLIIIVAVLSTIIWTTYRLWPDNEEELKASVVTIERTFYYEITQNGKPVLYTAALSADTLMERMSWNKDSINKSHRLTQGYWMNSFWMVPSYSASGLRKKAKAVGGTSFSR